MALASSRRLGAVMAKRQSGGNDYCPMSGCADAAVRSVTVPGPEIDKGGNPHAQTRQTPMPPPRGRRQAVCMQTATTLPASHLTARNATIMVVFWLHSIEGTLMPTTLTLKNIPDAVYAQLKVAAALHRRSLNSEAIVCLEAVLTPSTLPATARLARARVLRAGVQARPLDVRSLDAMKREGRA